MRMLENYGCATLAPALTSPAMAQQLPTQGERQAPLAEHYPAIRRYVLSFVHDRAEADDLTQETFLRAHRRRRSLRDPNAALPWLYGIATNVCLDRLRQRARRAPSESDLDPEAVSPADPEPGAALLAEREEMSSCVQSYLGKLSDSYRAVLFLHDVNGLSAREIAELLGDSPGNVKIRLHRARKKLRAALESGCEFSTDERGTLVCEPTE
jgi:RNA polymerase sigma-70 factor (ECF subfamily)